MSFSNIKPCDVNKSWSSMPVPGSGSKDDPLYWNLLQTEHSGRWRVLVLGQGEDEWEMSANYWYYLRLDSNVTYSFNISNMDEWSTSVKIYDEDNNQVAASEFDDYEWEWVLEYRPPETGVYKAHLSSYMYGGTGYLSISSPPLAIDPYIKRDRLDLVTRGLDEQGRAERARNQVDAGLDRGGVLLIAGEVWDGKPGEHFSHYPGFREFPYFKDLARNAKQVVQRGRVYFFLLWNGELWVVSPAGQRLSGVEGMGSTAVPQQIRPDVKWVSLDSSTHGGIYVMAAIDDQGRCWTWSRGGDYMVEAGRTGDQWPAPIGVPDCVDVAIGTYGGNVLDKDGYVWSWNRYGYYTGTGTGSSSALPPTRHTERRYRKIGSPNASVALDEDGYLWGWGRNSSQLLGEDTSTVHTPVKLGDMKFKDFSAYSEGYDSVIAIDEYDRLWGRGTLFKPVYGADPPVPIGENLWSWALISGSRWRKVYNRAVFRMAIDFDNKVHAWGQWDEHWEWRGWDVGWLGVRRYPVYIGYRFDEVYSMFSGGSTVAMFGRLPVVDSLAEPDRANPLGALLVSDGDPAYDGVYQNQGGANLSKWVSNEDPAISLSLDGSQWILQRQGEPVYQSAPVTDSPWEAEWALDNGSRLARVTALDWLLEDEEVPVVKSSRGGLAVEITGSDEGRWSVDDGETWYPGGVAIPLDAGEYEITFREVEQATRPKDRTVAVLAGDIVEVAAAYRVMDYYDPRRWGMEFTPSEEPVLAEGRRVWYVRPGGAGNMDGSDWANAMATRAEASGAAVSGDVIYVMEGEYFVYDVQSTKAGVDEYYGFSEEDPSWEARHPWEYRSIYDFSGGEGYFLVRGSLDGVWTRGCSSRAAFEGPGFVLRNVFNSVAIECSGSFIFSMGAENCAAINCSASTLFSAMDVFRKFKVSSPGCLAVNCVSSSGCLDAPGIAINCRSTNGYICSGYQEDFNIYPGTYINCVAEKGIVFCNGTNYDNGSFAEPVDSDNQIAIGCSAGKSIFHIHNDRAVKIEEPPPPKPPSSGGGFTLPNIWLPIGPLGPLGPTYTNPRSSTIKIQNYTAINCKSDENMFVLCGDSSHVVNCTLVNCEYSSLSSKYHVEESSKPLYTNTVMWNKPSIGCSIDDEDIDYGASNMPVEDNNNTTNFIDLSSSPYPFHPYDQSDPLPPGAYMPGLPQTYESLITIYHEILPRMTGGKVPNPRLLPNTILEGAGHYEEGLTPAHDADGTLRPIPPSIGAYEPSEYTGPDYDDPEPTEPPEPIDPTWLLLHLEDNVTDSSPNNQTSIYTNGTFVKGAIDQGLQFDSWSQQFLAIPYTSNPFGGDFTVSCWAKVTGYGRYALFSLSTDKYLGVDTSDGTWNMWAGNTGGASWNILQANTRDDNPTGDSGFGSLPVIVDQWQHIALVHKGNAWMLFVDGELSVKRIRSGNISYTNQHLRFGVWGGNSHHADMIIDEIHISTEALWDDDFTPPEIDIPSEPEPDQGTLKVNISGSSEGRWSIDSGSTWNIGGHSMLLAVGSYTVTFKDVEGYDTPSDATNTTITANSTTTLNITYEESTSSPSEGLDLLVSGVTDNPDFNGTYTYDGGEGNSRLWYKTIDSSNRYAIFHTAYEGWVLIEQFDMGHAWGDTDPPHSYNESTDPWDDGWTLMLGSGSPPTVTRAGGGEETTHNDIEVLTGPMMYVGIYAYESGDGYDRLWIMSMSENSQSRIHHVDQQWQLDVYHEEGGGWIYENTVTSGQGENPWDVSWDHNITMREDVEIIQSVPEAILVAGADPGWDGTYEYQGDNAAGNPWWELAGGTRTIVYDSSWLLVDGMPPYAYVSSDNTVENIWTGTWQLVMGGSLPTFTPVWGG